MTKFLTAADILSLPDKVVKKELKSAGGFVKVKRLSPADNERLAEFYEKHVDGEHIKYRRIDFQTLVLSLVIVEEDGKTPIFTSEDLAVLRGKDQDLWDELYLAFSEANPTGTTDEVKKAKENLSEPQAESLDSK